MAEPQRQREPMDAEDAKRLSEAIDTTSGPGPVLDQDRPAPMPLFDEHDRAGGNVHSAIDPVEFAELGDRTGDELDRIRPVADGDAPGVAGRAAPGGPPDEDRSGR